MAFVRHPDSKDIQHLRPMADLPDYYMGRLSIHDEDSDDNMRWIGYDGLTKVRCVSPTAAKKYIQEQAL